MNPAYIGRGTLQVVVTVGDDPSPIQGARVRVTDPADGAVLAELTTDSSGQTETIELPTPPIEDSIAESDVRPYATPTYVAPHPRQECWNEGSSRKTVSTPSLPN